MTSTIQATREAWLHAAIEIYRARFVEVGHPLPDKLYVSVGFAYGSKGESKMTRGQCWSKTASKDGVNHIFISPEIGDTAQVLLTLLHECIHAADDCQSGHRRTFAEVAKALGLVGKMTSSEAGIELAAELITIAAALGDYPHGQMDVSSRTRTRVPTAPGGGRIHSGPGKQGTRMVKVMCPDDGYTVRVSRKWLNEGMPHCPLHPRPKPMSEV